VWSSARRVVRWVKLFEKISRAARCRAHQMHPFVGGDPLRASPPRRRDPARPGPRRVVLVVDTFEEAQYLGDDVVRPLVRFLLEIARSLPAVCGSSCRGGRCRTRSRPMNLDQASARKLLRRSLALAKMPRTSAARRGRRPAVRGPQRDPDRLKEEKIQALLYGRILRHLHTDDAGAVGYPGLVVRRIAPDVIRDVLAEPCGLELRLEQLLQMVVIEEGRGNLESAARLLAEAAAVVAHSSDPVLRFRVTITQLRCSGGGTPTRTRGSQPGATRRPPW
jgi:hypothetical protein